MDVLSVAKSLADVAEKAIPEDVDGLCLDIGIPDKRPKIWVNRRLQEHRKRFTLAHEIGHIVIPWHSGSIVDQLDLEDPGERIEYYQLETEANRFAAELLMPDAWSTRICNESDNMASAMKTIAMVADVSAYAAALRVVQKGPPGHVMAAVVQGEIQWSNRTNGTRVRRPSRGLEIANLKSSACDEPHVVSFGRTDYFWWRQKESADVAPRPKQEWREILDDILTEIPDSQRAITKSRVIAIIGNAMKRTERGSDVGIIMQHCVEALSYRHDVYANVRAVLSHSRFMEYVLARAYERADG